MVDDDKKKDLENDYSSLSDVFDSDESAPSLEDLLKSHGIDLESDMDVDAMQDFSMSDTKSDEPKKEEDLFSENLFDDHFNDNLFNEPLPDLPAEPPASRGRREPAFEPVFDPMDQMEPATPAEPSDEHMFEVSDFDDDQTHHDVDLGSDPLFDYDPQGEATEATFADVGSADADLTEGGFGGGDVPPPSDKGPGAKRIFARLAVMLVLVSVIYGGLKLFLGEKPPQEVAKGLEEKAPPSKIAQISIPEKAPQAQQAPEVPEATKPAAPTMPEMPAATTTASAPGTTETLTPATAPISTPEATPAPTQVAATTPPAQPEQTQPVETQQVESGANTELAVQSPTTSLPVTVPIEAIKGHQPVAATSTPTTTSTQETLTLPVTAQTTSTTEPTDVHAKLDNLESALKSIDQRLSQVSSGGMGDEKMQRLERLVTDTNAPEMHDVLEQAVKKMKELDRKLERIAELQHQVRMLDTDVKMLKEDVVTQTNMVGEQQRLFNDNVQLSQMQEPGPVKMMVQAAIPGRAWLRSERGELLTVIPGDEVPGYGRVVSIDAASGTVVTSSRAVFREQ